MRTMMAGYTSPFSMTLKQANELDAKVIKGSKSSVIYYGTVERVRIEGASDDETDLDDPQTLPFMKSYSVFNADGWMLPPATASRCARLDLVEACEIEREHP